MLQSSGSQRLNEKLVLEGVLQGRVAMAGFLLITVLFYLNCGSFVVVISRPADGTTSRRATVALNTALTSTESLFSAGKPNTTEVPTAGFTTRYRKSISKPTTAPESLSEAAGKKTEREEEEEGPPELGEWTQTDIYFCFSFSLMLFNLKLMTNC